MLEAWQVVLLVLSNLILWVPIAWTLWHGQFVDATVLFLLFLASTLYHVCQSGNKNLCVSTLWEQQALDHVFVYLTIAWLGLTFWAITPDVRFGLFLTILFLAVLVLVETTRTFTFAVFLGWFFVLFGALRFVGIGEPIRRYDVALIVVAGLLLGGGFALHLVSGDPDSSRYWWMHSSWHVLAMSGILVVILLRDGVFVNWGLDASVLWHPRGKKRTAGRRRAADSLHAAAGHHGGFVSHASDRIVPYGRGYARATYYGGGGGGGMV